MWTPTIYWGTTRTLIAYYSLSHIVGNHSCAYDSPTARPPFEYVKGGGGIFCDMAIHDLDMARLLLTMALLTMALLTMWPYLPWPYLL